MLAKINGTVMGWDSPMLLLEVGPLTVEVQVALADWSVPEIGSQQTLHIHMVIRDDAWLLYGFVTEDHRRMFRMLIKLDTIGPAKALAMLSHMSLAEFCGTIRAEDDKKLSSLPGIGQRIAKKIVLDLRERLDDFAVAGDDGAVIDGASQVDAIEALKSLGYSARDARDALQQVYKSGLDTGELVKLALQELGTN